ncbi:MAG: NAD kinase [Microbacterium sp.]|nr:NAD kinase [Microbacterium sp.]
MTTKRYILVVAHTGRTDALDSAAEVARELQRAGVHPVMVDVDLDQLHAHDGELGQVQVLFRHVAVEQLEAAIVLGGDGTILKAAELVRGSQAPLLGVNLGHVGFLAEAEREDLTETVRRLVERRYDVEERMTIDVEVIEHGETVYHDWALNEASVEKASRARMIEVVIEVNAHPLSSFGCDGVVMSTPTGSTAYSFSAGGPVVWPNIDALLCVPLSAHALFAKPILVGADSVLAVELLERTRDSGVLWCDGRRQFDLEPGARIEVRKGATPVRLARLARGVFTDRLVRKFDLPVRGWRGPAER